MLSALDAVGRTLVPDGKMLFKSLVEDRIALALPTPTLLCDGAKKKLLLLATATAEELEIKEEETIESLANSAGCRKLPFCKEGAMPPLPMEIDEPTSVS